MAWSANDIPDLSGKVAVVTGANGGLGYETSLELAAHGARVVMAVRNMDKAVDAEQRIRSLVPGADITLQAMDLASLESIRAAAGSIVAANDSIDLLFNNAGVMAIPERTTADGFEMQFGTNHLGHFVFTAKLLARLAAAPAARVVTTTSSARHMGRPVDPDNPHMHGKYGPWTAYGQSKLANLYFALELHRRLRAAGSSVASLVAHPGFAHTDLQSTSAEATGGLFEKLADRSTAVFAQSAHSGAMPQLRAGTDPLARSGELYAPAWVSAGPAVKRPLVLRSNDRNAAATLWEVSERETGEGFDVAALVS